MENESKKKPGRLDDRDLSDISGGAADDYDLDKVLKEQEEWMKQNGVQFFGWTATQADDQDQEKMYQTTIQR